MSLRDNVNLIIPGLYLGNAKSSLDDEFLRKNNIRAVFNCTKDLPFHHSIRNKYRIPVDDNLKAEEIDYIAYRNTSTQAVLTFIYQIKGMELMLVFDKD